mmetsp:Transcript_24334/g.49589  ORF Transcript_24334/g.49589 Transcript_24334/m.49589 type:complete len:254 (-) Transcript_24334:571-1332(-)
MPRGKRQKFLVRLARRMPGARRQQWLQRRETRTRAPEIRPEQPRKHLHPGDEHQQHHNVDGPGKTPLGPRVVLDGQPADPLSGPRESPEVPGKIPETGRIGLAGVLRHAARETRTRAMVLGRHGRRKESLLLGRHRPIVSQRPVVGRNRVRTNGDARVVAATRQASKHRVGGSFQRCHYCLLSVLFSFHLARSGHPTHLNRDATHAPEPALTVQLFRGPNLVPVCFVMVNCLTGESKVGMPIRLDKQFGNKSW